MACSKAATYFCTATICRNAFFTTVNNTDGKLAGSFSERPFAICEIGFGTGLNFLVTLLAWSGAARKQIEKLQANQHAGQLPQIRPLTYIACDQLFLPVKEMKTVHANWPELAAVSSILLAAMDQAEWTDNACTLKLDLFPADNYARLPLAPVTLHLIGGEITETIRRLENGYLKINAWFLDGFAPDRNPAMWSEAVFDGLKNDSAPDATAATYSCAAHVREQFTRAGFAWEKTPGFGKKRFMLQASLLMQKNYNT